MVTFPMPIFLPQSDIAPVRARKQEFYEGLTRWKLESSAAAPERGRMVALEAPDFEQALVRFNHLALANRWGDGLPLWVAPDPALIARLTDACARRDIEILGPPMS